MMITSVQVGQAAIYQFRGEQIVTASFKYPVEGALYLGSLGFVGDAQADRLNHGGPDKAALVYAADHYLHWQRFLGAEPGPAVLGENLTVNGATEDLVCIGDTYRLGRAIAEVSQPRVPCFKMNLRHGRSDLLTEIIRTGYTGFYVRVIEEGLVQAGDQFTLVNRPVGALTIASANRIYHGELANREGLEQLLGAKGLAEAWRTRLSRLLG